MNRKIRSFACRHCVVLALSLTTPVGITTAAMPSADANPLERSSFGNHWGILGTDIFFGGAEELFGLSPASRTLLLFSDAEFKNRSLSTAIVTEARREDLSGFASALGSPFAYSSGAPIVPNAPTPPDYYWDTNGATLGAGGTGTWDFVTANWNEPTGSTAPAPWVNGNNAFFQGTAGTVTLTSGLIANAWNVSVDGYTFTGGDLTVGAGNISITPATGITTVNSLIEGTASLTKTGGSTLVLTNQNTYSGGTIWGNPASQSAAGIISLGSSSIGGPLAITSGPLGTGTFTVRNSGTFAGGNYIQSTDTTTRTISNPIAFGGTGINFNTGGTGNLVFDGPVNLGSGGRTFSINNPQTSFSGIVSGSGSITKNGSGTMILSGSNTYSSGTTVNAGTLLINNGVLGSGTGSGVINVSNSGTTLGGTGTILAGSNNVTINTGANITGGTDGSVGTLTLTTNALVISGTYLNDINGATADRITLGGNLVLTGATLDFNVINAPTAPVYNLLTYTGTLSGAFTEVGTPAGYEVIYNPQSIDLVAIPEPGTWIGATLGLLAIFFTQRRRLRGLVARPA